MDRLFTVLVLLIGLVGVLPAQKKPSVNNEPPLLTFALPIGLDLGKVNKITLRGLRFEELSELRSHEPRSFGKLVGKPSKVAVPNNAPVNLYGDSTITAELTLPAELAGKLLAVTVVGPGGESKPVRLLVNDTTPRLAEKEPNDGFRTAQPVTVPVAVDGVIQNGQDVDIYAVTVKAGQTLTAEVWANRLGIPLDPILEVYDGAGRLIVRQDDAPDSADPRVTWSVNKDSVFYVCVSDAHDTGGPTHAYRLYLKLGP